MTEHHTNTDRRLFKASNKEAMKQLCIPILLGLVSVIFGIVGWRVMAFLTLSFFLTQQFLLLHECGHGQFFSGIWANRIVGFVAGVLSGIPYYTWVHMHQLHHKWTGWRDLDPTTAPTVALKGGKGIRWLVNVCWRLCIPIFFVAYQLGNYWNVFKIKRYVTNEVWRKACWHILLSISLYVIGWVLLPYSIIIGIGISYAISLFWKECIIMTQHNHIDIPLAKGQLVRPVRYSEQVSYTRSFRLPRFWAHYVLFNVNFHQAHHLKPGVPAYYLPDVEVQQPLMPHIKDWFIRSRSMKGEDYIFKTSRQTGQYF
jgi:acyl-lipid omega-6 desaturase (Delta-12 desaturase)